MGKIYGFFIYIYSLFFVLNIVRIGIGIIICYFIIS